MSSPNMDNPEADKRWLRGQRQAVADYLRGQCLDHGPIGNSPAWCLAPYVSMWAVESVARPGWIGWWAISGDLPTDYISSSEVDDPQHPRKAMRVFARNWLALAEAWSNGRDIENTTIGDLPERAALAPLLQARARVLGEWAANDLYWNE